MAGPRGRPAQPSTGGCGVGGRGPYCIRDPHGTAAAVPHPPMKTPIFNLIRKPSRHRLYSMVKDEPVREGSRYMSDVLSRITHNPQQCGGRPCIRGMRIRVSDVLDLFAAGLSSEQIL